jgi:hypothetical protein
VDVLVLSFFVFFFLVLGVAAVSTDPTKPIGGRGKLLETLGLPPLEASPPAMVCIDFMACRMPFSFGGAGI